MSHPGNDFINDLIADGEEHEEPDLRSDDYEVDLMYEDAMDEYEDAIDEYEDAMDEARSIASDVIALLEGDAVIQTTGEPDGRPYLMEDDN